ncbi:MAG: right-handed parallel beta-helix repeat-containing protein [Planctomycetes bacterium]|nr:right-handed parallel beta-helix repeat-containing protein [Planctomycetota bacterium]
MKCNAPAIGVLLSLLQPPCSGDLFVVDPVDGPIRTIAQATAAAESGDEIAVLPGVYKEHVVLPDGVILYSADMEQGPLVTIIDGDGNLPEVLTLSSGCVVEGFAVVGSADGGCAIGADGSIADAIIVACDIAGSDAGIRIPAGSSSVLVVNALFYGNRGPAVDIDGAGPIEILGATIHGCGAGIDVRGGAEVYLRNSIIAACAGPGIGDAADAVETIDVEWCDVHGNAPDWTGLDAQIARDRGQGNMSVDPFFLDPASGDFRPGTCSPVKDSGDPDPFYEDCPIEDVFTRAEIGAFCSEAEGGPPRDIACAAAADANELAWTNADAYQAILIERDGQTIANLPGHPTGWRDADPPPAAVYRVVGVAGARICESVPCGVARYTVLTSDADPDAAYEWVDVGAGPSLPPVDGYVSEPIPIGFAFPFMGAPRSDVRIAVDGYLLFGSDGDRTEPVPVPSPEAPNLLIAAYGSDLSTDLQKGSGRVRFAILGTSGQRVFVAEWDGVTHPRETGKEETPESFQVRLEEATGRIEIAYRATATGGGRHPDNPADGVAIGIEDDTGLAGVALGFTTPGLVRDGFQVVFAPLGTQTEPVFLRGDVSADGLLQLNDPILLLSFLFSGGAPPVCPDAADLDDSGDFTIGDAVWDLNYLFASGAPPADPGALACGPDPTVDALDPCEYPAAGCP